LVSTETLGQEVRITMDLFDEADAGPSRDELHAELAELDRSVAGLVNMVFQDVGYGALASCLACGRRVIILNGSRGDFPSDNAIGKIWFSHLCRPNAHIAGCRGRRPVMTDQALPDYCIRAARYILARDKAPPGIDPQGIAKVIGRNAMALVKMYVQAEEELARVRAERDRLVAAMVDEALAERVSDRAEALTWPLSCLGEDGSIPPDVAAALAEHDRQSTKGSQ
jgi:hypothetical protein